MAEQHVVVRVEAAAGPEEVWPLLADVTTWPTWSTFTEAQYERPGEPAPHGVGAVRKLRAGPLRSSETVLAFEPPLRLSYDYSGTLPLKGYRADVVLEATDTGSRITWSASFRGSRGVPGAVMRPLVRKVLREVAGRLATAADQRRAEGHAERSTR